MKKFVVACGGARFLESPVCTARRRGVPFTRVKGTKTCLGRCPKTPVAGCAGYGLIFDGSRKSIRTAHRIAPKVACGSICPFPPPPFPRRERGPDGRVIMSREQNSRGVRACKNRKAADPWLWLAGLAACTEREGVPLPRSGGGWEGANASAIPYKHRLAHDPGRQSRSGRAFQCVGVLGFTPSRFWALLASQKCHLGGSRTNYDN